MSSVNPVVVLPGALAQQDPAALAQAFVGSLTLGESAGDDVLLRIEHDGSVTVLDDDLIRIAHEVRSALRLEGSGRVHRSGTVLALRRDVGLP